MEKYCKSCGRVFKDSDFKICPYCGNQLSTRTGRQPIPRKLRHQVFQRDGYRCRECGATNKQTRLHVDHIKPVAKGGTNDLSNLQTLCEACNRAKYTDEWIGGTYDNHSYGNHNDLYELNRKQREINLAKHYGRKINNSPISHNDLYSNLIIRCPECNTVLNHKAKKCVKCGQKIKRSKSTYKRTDNPSNKLKNEIKLNDECAKIVDEFKICNDINVVSKKVGITAIQIKRWYRQGKRGDVDYEGFYNILSSLNPKMDIKEFDLDSLSTFDQLKYVASSFKKNKDIKLVSEHTGVNEVQIRKWFKLGKRGQWPYKIFYDEVSKFM